MTTYSNRDVYLASSSTHEDHEAWLVDSNTSFYMTPQRDWFCEYESYYGGDVFLGDDSTTKIIGRGKLKLNFMDGRIRTLPSVLHIRIGQKFYFYKKNGRCRGQKVFEKETCRMV
jgi:hypothetical protein